MKLIPELSREDDDVETYIHTYEDTTIFVTTTNGLINLVTFEAIVENVYVELYYDVYKGECYDILHNNKKFNGNTFYVNNMYLELTTELFSKT